METTIVLEGGQGTVFDKFQILVRGGHAWSPEGLAVGTWETLCKQLLDAL